MHTHVLVKVPSSAHVHMYIPFSSSLEIINGYFKQLLEEQDFLATREQWSKMLALVPRGVASELDKEWQDNCTMTSTERWRRLRYELRVNHTCFSI